MANKNENLPELEILGENGEAENEEVTPDSASDRDSASDSESVVPLARVTELAYNGASEGSGVFCPVNEVNLSEENPTISAEPLRLAVLLRPQVPMRQLVAVGPVAAMAVLDALEELGANPDAIGIAWPHDVVLIGDETKLPGSFVSLATLSTKAGYADGMFVALGIDIDAAALADALVNALSVSDSPEGVASQDASARSPKQAPSDPASSSHSPSNHVSSSHTSSDHSSSNYAYLSPEAQVKFARSLQSHLVSAMRQWEKNAATPNAQAGPWAPFLQDYFDRVPLLGQAVNVCYPSGHVYARGIFVGIDIWGRATVRTRRAGDIEFPAEKFRIEPQSY